MNIILKSLASLVPGGGVLKEFKEAIEKYKDKKSSTEVMTFDLQGTCRHVASQVCKGDQDGRSV
jgi:hypothetical protein